MWLCDEGKALMYEILALNKEAQESLLAFFSRGGHKDETMVIYESESGLPLDTESALVLDFQPLEVWKFVSVV